MYVYTIHIQILMGLLMQGGGTTHAHAQSVQSYLVLVQSQCWQPLASHNQCLSNVPVRHLATSTHYTKVEGNVYPVCPRLRAQSYIDVQESLSQSTGQGSAKHTATQKASATSIWSR